MSLLLLVILITNFVSLFFLFPEELSNLFKTNISIIFFYSNFYFWKNTDYFNDITSQSPLLHTWSLSVEEQFYIFFPLIFLIFLRLKKKKLFVYFSTAIIFLSLVSTSFLSKFSSDANFFFTTSRIFEIGIGVLCALIVSENLVNKKFNKFFNINLSIFFFVILLSSFFIFNEDDRLPNFLTLIPLLATVYFILNNNVNFITKFLSSKFMIIIGKSSYSLYLFHYPIFVFFNLYNLYYLKLLPLPILFLISYVSWKYFETPFRNKNIINNRKLFIFLFNGFLILFLIYFNQDKLKILLNKKIYQNDFYNHMNKANNDRGKLFTQNCKIYTRSIDEKFLKKFDQCKSKYDNSVLIIGDSHADDLFNAYVLNYPKQEFVVGIGKGGCRLYENENKCPYDKIIDLYLQNQNIFNYIFFTQVGSDYLTGNYKLPVQKNKIEKIASYLKNFPEFKTKVVWFGPQPEPGIMMNSYQAIRAIKSKKYEMYENKKIKYVDKEMGKIAEDKGIFFISKFDNIKYQPHNDFFVDNNFTYSDTDHWTSVGEKLFGSRLFNSEDFKKIYSK